MNFNHMRYVVEINRCGSINKAAHNLFISQSNLSKAIKNLEQMLGYAIFSRSSDGIVLTAEGELFLKSAKSILEECEKIKNIPQNISKVENLHMCCTYSAFLMQTLINFRQTGDKSDDHMRETGLKLVTDHIIEQWHRLALFYCFRSYMEKLWETFEKYDLEPTMLAKDIQLVAMMSAEHPLAGKEELDIEELRKCDLAVWGGIDPQYWIDGLGLDKTCSPLVVYDRAGMDETVLTGSYVAITMGELQEEQRQPEIRKIPITGMKNKTDMFLLKRAGYVLNSRESDFVEFLKRRLDKLALQNAR